MSIQPGIHAHIKRQRHGICLQPVINIVGCFHVLEPAMDKHGLYQLPFALFEIPILLSILYAAFSLF